MRAKQVTGADLCTGGIVRVSLTGTGPGGFGEYDLDDTQSVFDAVAGHTDYLTAHRFCVLMEAHGRYGERVQGGIGYVKWTQQMHLKIDPDEGNLDRSFDALADVKMNMQYADGMTMTGPLVSRHGVAFRGNEIVYRIIRLPSVLQKAVEAMTDAK